MRDNLEKKQAKKRLASLCKKKKDCLDRIL